MTSLLARLARPFGKTEPMRFTVYTRRECCCCHKALDLLKKFKHRHRFTIEEIDIDADPELVERHGESVPVVEVDGKVRFRGVINPVLLERLLASRPRHE